MRRRLLIVLVAASVLLGSGVGALYLYDASADDVLAGGVTVAGINVGDMQLDDARRVLGERLRARVAQPVTLVYRKRKLTLSAAEAEVRPDVEGMVKDALEQSRKGTFVTRAFRRLLGRDVEVDVDERVDYSVTAVTRFVGRVKRRIDRPARNARVVPSPNGLRTVRARDGVAVRAQALERLIAAQLSRPAGARLVGVPVEVENPRVTTEELAAKYPAFITISRKQKRLRLYRRLRLTKAYEIAVGQAGFETPTGLHRIQSKAVNPAWEAPNKPWAGEFAGKIVPPGSPDNPIKARWMEFYDGAGIHGTDDVASLGSAASHGCIRMSIPDVVELFERVSVRTPVYIG